MHQNILWLQWVKLEIYNKKTIGKSPNVWVLSNVLLYKWWVKKTHIVMEIRKCVKLNDKDNITYKSLWDATTAVHGGKHTALIAHIEKRKTKNHQSIHLKKPGEKITECLRLLEVTDMFMRYIMVYIYVQNHQVVYIKYVQRFVCLIPQQTDF